MIRRQNGRDLGRSGPSPGSGVWDQFAGRTPVGPLTWKRPRGLVYEDNDVWLCEVQWVLEDLELPP